MRVWISRKNNYFNRYSYVYLTITIDFSEILFMYIVKNNFKLSQENLILYIKL